MSVAVDAGLNLVLLVSLRVSVAWNAKHYAKSPALTDCHEFAGRDHWTCATPGWEEVADFALEWAAEHASTRHLNQGRTT